MSLVTVPELDAKSKSCTFEELREELQRFAETALRQELVRLRSQLQQDFQAEPQDFHGKGKSRNTFQFGKRLQLLHDPEEACRVKPPGSLGTPAPWADCYNLPARSPAVHPRRTDIVKNDRLEAKDVHAEVKKTVDQSIVDVPLPGSRLSESTDEVQPPPTHELRMLGDTQFENGEESRKAGHGDARPEGSFFDAQQTNVMERVKSEPEDSYVDESWPNGTLISRVMTRSFSIFKPSEKASSRRTSSDVVQTRSEENGVKNMRRIGVRDLQDLEELETTYQVQQMIERRRNTTKMRLRQAVQARENSLQAKLCDFLGDFMEQGIMCVIVLNGIFIGVQTDYQARNVTESVPEVFRYTEILFCIIFTAELIVKLLAHRLNFFTQRGWHWNVFDMILVCFQLIEVVGMFASNHESSSDSSSSGSGNNPVGNVSFLRLLRILRLMRILRLVRLLHFVGELATIISSIANCFRALTGTVILLLMMIYVVGIFFAQIVFSHRVGGDEDDSDTPLALWWGSLGCATLTLYQAILGGVDWETVSTPLHEVSPVCSIVFCFYIAFSLLGMMNIITGSFVQSALKHSENEKTKDFRTAARSAFMSEGQTHVAFDDFVQTIEGESLKHWMVDMGIEAQDARLLYRLLSENSEMVNTERLVASLISLRDGAKFIDIMKLMYELKFHQSQLDEWFQALRSDLPSLNRAKTFAASPSSSLLE